MNERIIEPRIELLSSEIDSDLMSHAIRSVTYNKSLFQPVGTGEVRLSPNLSASDWALVSNSFVLEDWYASIEPMDLLNLTIAKVDAANPNWLVKGCVDNVFRSKSQTMAYAERAITIRFSDLLGKIIAKDEIAYLATLTDDPKVKELFTEDRLVFYNTPFGHGLNTEAKQNIFIGGSIVQAIEYILDKMQGTRIVVPSGRRTSIDVSNEIRKHRSIISDPYDYVFRVDLTKFAGTVYEFIVNVLDKEFYELYIDTVADKSTLFVRPIPFETSVTQSNSVYKDLPKWDTLPTIELSDDDIFSDNTGISDYEVKTMFRCYNDLDIFGSQDSVIGRYGTNFPLINLDAVKRYGLRQHEGRSTVANSRDAIIRQSVKDGKTTETAKLASTSFIESTIRRKRNKLFRWYGYPFFESGRLVVRGNQDIRIGTRVLCTDKFSRRGKRGVMYYVTDVSTTWAFGAPYTLSLAVTRGQEKDGQDVVDYFNEIKANLVGNSGAFASQDIMKDELVDGVAIYDQQQQEEIDRQTKVLLSGVALG